MDGIQPNTCTGIRQLIFVAVLVGGVAPARGQTDPDTDLVGAATSTAVLDDNLQIKHYQVDKILHRLDREAGFVGKEAEQWLDRRVRLLFPSDDKSEDSGATQQSAAVSEKRTTSSQVSVQTPGGERFDLSLNEHGCGTLLTGTSLSVVCPKTTQLRVRQLLDTLSQFGLRQVVIQTYVFRGPTQQVMALPVRWSHVEAMSQIAEAVQPSARPSAGAPPVPPVVPASTIAGSYLSKRKLQDAQDPDLAAPPGATGETWTEATSFVERSTPVLYTLLTPDEKQDLLNAATDQESIHKVMSPNVVVFNGQTATASDSVQRPFVTGLQPMRVGSGDQQQIEFAPKIRVYPEGTTIKMQPQLVNGDRVRLNYHLQLCKIHKSEVLNIPSFAGQPDWTIQMPEVASTSFRTRLDLPFNYSLAVAAFETDEGGNRQSVLVISHCTVRNMESLQP